MHPRLKTNVIARRLLVGLLVCTQFAVGASDASAVIVRLQNGHALSYQSLKASQGGATHSLVRPFDLAFSNLDYNGGPVMASNTNYAFYWDPSGAPAYPPEYQNGINQYFEDLAHDSGAHENTDSVATQYNDAAGEFANYDSHFAGAIVDTDPYPANGCTRAAICLTDAQIQSELTSYIAGHNLPRDLAHEYFVLTPPGVEGCFESSGEECSAGSSKPYYCAYHSNIPVEGSEIIYADDPYVGGNGGCDDGDHPNGISDSAIEGGLSHEHNESITDPVGGSGWADFAGLREGEEIGDKCNSRAGYVMGAPLGKAPNGANYNQVINGHFYWYQEEWSNQRHECLQRLTFAGERPTATFMSFPEGTNKVRFVAADSTATSGVAHYDWQFDEDGEPGAPVETTTPTITHTFPDEKSHVVALTVFAADGSSIGTARTVPIGDEGPNAAFSLVGSPATVGEQAFFDASASTDPDGGIVSYSWDFGDGSTQSGVSASHTFASQGAYEVKLTVTDSAGLSATKTQEVVVYPLPKPSAGPENHPAQIEPVQAIHNPAAPTPASPPAVSAPAISASVVKATINKNWTADILVRVTAPGALTAIEYGRLSTLVRSARVQVWGRRLVKMHIVLSRIGLRLLKRRHILAGEVIITCGLSTGAFASQAVHFTLHLHNHSK